MSRWPRRLASQACGNCTFGQRPQARDQRPQPPSNVHPPVNNHMSCSVATIGRRNRPSCGTDTVAPCGWWMWITSGSSAATVRWSVVGSQERER
ncbi:MAG: hypothetical protein EBR28_06525 [Planctomycetia bacterium]|nr:hypothetical protein [Planctomycetia bacterium]